MFLTHKQKHYLEVPLSRWVWKKQKPRFSSSISLLPSLILFFFLCKRFHHKSTAYIKTKSIRGLKKSLKSFQFCMSLGVFFPWTLQNLKLQNFEHFLCVFMLATCPYLFFFFNSFEWKFVVCIKLESCCKIL